MKKKTDELEVDFIGSQERLTKEEELAISNYFSNRKMVKGNPALQRKPEKKKKAVPVKD
jgi:hypothetical protein